MGKNVVSLSEVSDEMIQDVLNRFFSDRDQVDDEEVEEVVNRVFRERFHETTE